jgi:hypothetical protein
LSSTGNPRAGLSAGAEKEPIVATKKPMTEKQDMKMDKKQGVKEGSARDMKIDKRDGVKADAPKKTGGVSGSKRRGD